MSGGSKFVIGGHSKDISYIAGKSFSKKNVKNQLNFTPANIFLIM